MIFLIGRLKNYTRKFQVCDNENIMSTKCNGCTQHESNPKNVAETFAIEGITLNNVTQKNLERIESGQASYQQVVNELRAKYDHTIPEAE